MYLAHPPASYAGRAEEIDDLFRAVADLHVLEFRYRPGTPAEQPVGDGVVGRGERVESHPYAVLLHRGAIHLIGRDTATGRTRAFLFERMAEVTLRDAESFVVPADLRAADFAHGIFGVAAGEAKTRVLVEFDARVADEIRRKKAPSDAEDRHGSGRAGPPIAHAAGVSLARGAPL